MDGLEAGVPGLGIVMTLLVGWDDKDGILTGGWRLEFLEIYETFESWTWNVSLKPWLVGIEW